MVLGFVGSGFGFVGHRRGRAQCEMMAAAGRRTAGPAVAKEKGRSKRTRSVSRSPSKVSGEGGGRSSSSVIESQEKREREVKEKLVMDNLGFVVALARNMHWNRSPHYDDIVQEGFVGLMYAAEKFDKTKGVPFPTYASYWIRQAMSRGNKKSQLIQIPYRKRQLATKARRIQDELLMKLGRVPTVAETAAELKWSIDTTEEALLTNSQMKAATVSLDAVDVNSPETLPDIKSRPEIQSDVLRTESMEAAQDVARILDETLKPNEREVIRNRFGLGTEKRKSRKEMADGLNVSEVTVTNTKDRAINKLREREAELIPYLAVL